jgi:hypothetical protein
MGLFDVFKKNKSKGQELLSQHGDKVVEGVDKATDVVDDKTGGKYTGQLDQVDDAAKKLVDGSDNA